MLDHVLVGRFGQEQLQRCDFHGVGVGGRGCAAGRGAWRCVQQQGFVVAYEDEGVITDLQRLGVACGEDGAVVQQQGFVVAHQGAGESRGSVLSGCACSEVLLEGRGLAVGAFPTGEQGA